MEKQLDQYQCGCGCTDLVAGAFDLGKCPETGYHDAGTCLRCRACGEVVEIV